MDTIDPFDGANRPHDVRLAPDEVFGQRLDSSLEPLFWLRFIFFGYDFGRSGFPSGLFYVPYPASGTEALHRALHPLGDLA